MDADHATPIHEIEYFLEDLRTSDCGVVAGVRTYQENESKWRRVLGLSAQLLSHLIVFEKAVVDSQCGFKLFTASSARKLFPYCRVNGGMIDVELFSLMHQYSVPCYFRPVHWANKSGSRINIVLCMVRDPIDLLKIRLRRVFHAYDRPLETHEQPWNVKQQASQQQPSHKPL
jgi:dolichyl-phosphate beta-glucosyltransferase